MDLLDMLTVYYGSQARTIELHRGDLTNLAPQESIDILLVSAFPNNYLPITGTPIGALYRRGVSVEELAATKALDLRHSCSSWLSQELTPPPGVQIKRILCYEPPIFGSVTEVIGDMFRCLAQVLSFDEPASIAIPLVATGAHGEPVSEVIAATLDAAAHWMALGMPLRQIKLVEQSSAKAVEMRRIFERLKGNYPTSLSAPRPSYDDDLVFSYSLKDGGETAQALAAELRRQRPELRINLQRLDLNPHTAWQQALYERISNCRAVVALYSPQYMRSKVCQEEFNLAHYRDQAASEQILFPVFAQDTPLLPAMQALPFVDCRQGTAQIPAACADLLARLGW
ncbi:MAG TPA: toll/interleukin-1 receptor domain-containing protein [Herpetosiphonaceae bacterium]